MANETGGPAFPVGDFFHGMTLRDWFAGQALAGLLACPAVEARPGALAAEAYRYADLVLRARSAE